MNIEAAAGGHHNRCTDPDDQKFLDLAIALGRCMNRDRAVLKLARRRPLGVTIVSPQHWRG